VKDRFIPYLEGRDQIIGCGYLGSKAFPPILGWEYFFCLTRTRLCFYTECPFGKTQYSEVYLEDIVTAEVSKPSLFYATVASWFAGITHSSREVMEDITPAAKLHGIISLDFMIWLCQYLVASAVVGIAIYSVLYAIFSRPVFTLSAFGGRVLISTSAMGSRAKVLR